MAAKTTKNTKQPTVEDLFNLMLQKADMKKEAVFKVSMKNFIMNNLDLLTPTERKQYEHLFAK